MDRQIRILHVLPDFLIRGAEIDVVRLSSCLARRGFDQRVVSLTADVDSSLVSRLSVPFSAPDRVLRFPSGPVYLAKLLRHAQVDLIHGTNFSTWLDCAAAKMTCRRSVRLVQAFHGPGTFESQRIRRRLTAVGLRYATDRFVAVSHFVAGCLTRKWGIPGRHVAVIPNGIDTVQNQPPSDKTDAKLRLDISGSTFVIGSVGSLYRIKNHRLLVSAFSGFVRHHPESVLLLIGDGETRCELESQARELGIQNQVRFCGYQTRVPDYLAAMDIYVQPSTHEGSPLAVMEAMACGIPVLAARSAGSCELNEDCGLPILVNPQSTEDLLQRLLELANDEPRRQSLGVQGRQIILQQYSLERMVDDYERVFRSVVEPQTRNNHRSVCCGGAYE